MVNSHLLGHLYSLKEHLRNPESVTLPPVRVVTVALEMRARPGSRTWWPSRLADREASGKPPVRVMKSDPSPPKLGVKMSVWGGEPTPVPGPDTSTSLTVRAGGPPPSGRLHRGGPSGGTAPPRRFWLSVRPALQRRSWKTDTRSAVIEPGTRRDLQPHSVSQNRADSWQPGIQPWAAPLGSCRYYENYPRLGGGSLRGRGGRGVPPQGAVLVQR